MKIIRPNNKKYLLDVVKVYFDDFKFLPKKFIVAYFLVILMTIGMFLDLYKQVQIIAIIIMFIFAREFVGFLGMILDYSGEILDHLDKILEWALKVVFTLIVIGLIIRLIFAYPWLLLLI